MAPMSATVLRPISEAEPDPGVGVFTSTASAGTFNPTFNTTTGRAKVEWWDGTTNIYGNGSAVDFSGVKSAAVAGTKVFRVYSCDASGVKSGTMTRFRLSSSQLTAADVRGLTGLTELQLASNSITSINVGRCVSLITLLLQNNPLRTLLGLPLLSALQGLNISSSSLTALDLSNAANLTSLNVANVPIEGLNLTPCVALQTFEGYGTATTSLNFSTCTNIYAVYVAPSPLLTSLTGLTNKASLYDLQAGSTGVTSIDVSGSGVYFIRIQVSPVATLRAAGCGIAGGKWKNKKSGVYQANIDIQSCQLSAAALNTFFTDLSAVTPGTAFIVALSNPGSATCNPSIATAKGYVVIR